MMIGDKSQRPGHCIQKITRAVIRVYRTTEIGSTKIDLIKEQTPQNKHRNY